MNRKHFFLILVLLISGGAGYVLFSDKNVVKKNVTENQMGNKVDSLSKKPKVAKRVDQKKSQLQVREPAQVNEIEKLEELLLKGESLPLESLKVVYGLKDELSLRASEDIEYYLSTTHKTTVVPERDFDTSLGEVFRTQWGFLEYKTTPLDPYAGSDQNFPVVVNKLNNDIGYMTGEVIVSYKDFNELDLSDIKLIHKDKDLNRVFLKVRDFSQVKSLSDKYSGKPNFEITIKTGEIKAI